MKLSLLAKYLLLVIVGLSFFGILLYARIQIAAGKSSVPSPTPTAQPVLGASATPKPKTEPTTQKVSDPIVDCTSTAPNCNGESIRLKQSQCKNITCCGFKNGIWKVYASKEECNKAQASEVQQPSVTATTTPSTQQNYYCYDNTNKYWFYTSSGEHCNELNYISSCLNLAKITVWEPCTYNCKQTVPLDDDGNLYQACLDSCGPSYQEAMNKCYK